MCDEVADLVEFGDKRPDDLNAVRTSKTPGYRLNL